MKYKEEYYESGNGTNKTPKRGYLIPSRESRERLFEAVKKVRVEKYVKSLR